jgi:hypothetical protein
MQENQITAQESTDKILPKLGEVERELQKMRSTLRRSMIELSIDGRVEKKRESTPRRRSTPRS